MTPRACLVAAFIVSSVTACRSEPTPEQVSGYSQWLGEQTKNVVHPLYVDHDPREECWDVSLSVVQGSKLEVPGTKNPVVSFDGSKVVHLQPGTKLDHARYLVVRADFNATKGWYVYEFTLRVDGGPLNGAVVRIRNGHLPETISDPLVGIYRIPDVLRVSEGPQDFEVINFVAK